MVAFTVAVRVICAPAAALELTAEPASSSSLCPVCRLPTLQVALLADAHTANVGAATPATLPMLAVTWAPLALAFVVHTKIAKLAVLPGRTVLPAYGATDTQSCGSVGVGVGVGVGVCVGDGEVEGVGDAVADVDGDTPLVLVGLLVPVGSDDGVALADALGLGVALEFSGLAPDVISRPPELELVLD